MATFRDLLDLIRELRVAPSDIKISKKMFRHVSERAEEVAQEEEKSESEEED